MEFPPRIALAEAKRLLNRGEPVVFIDARRSEKWRNAELQLPGALRIPPEEYAALPFDEIPMGNPALVVYCDCPREQSSAVVAHKLIDHGFKRTFVLDGGFDRWFAAGAVMERKGSRRAARVTTQPNLVVESQDNVSSPLGKGPSGESNKSRD